MDKIRLKDKEFELFIPEKEIKDAIAKMAKQIKADVGDTNPLFVGILNGAFMFTAELMRQMDTYYEITFARYSSYRGLNSTGVVREIMPVQADVKGRTLILLEDVRAGLWVPSTLRVLIISVPFLLVGMFIGSKLYARMSQLVFMKLTYILLFISGLTLLVK